MFSSIISFQSFCNFILIFFAFARLDRDRSLVRALAALSCAHRPLVTLVRVDMRVVLERYSHQWAIDPSLRRHDARRLPTLIEDEIARPQISVTPPAERRWHERVVSQEFSGLVPARDGVSTALGQRLE